MHIHITLLALLCDCFILKAKGDFHISRPYRRGIGCKQHLSFLPFDFPPLSSCWLSVFVLAFHIPVVRRMPNNHEIGLTHARTKLSFGHENTRIRTISSYGHIHSHSPNKSPYRHPIVYCPTLALSSTISSHICRFFAGTFL